MQHQNLDLCADRVAVLNPLAPGVLERNRNIADEPKRLARWKGQHVGGVILLEKIPIQAAQLRIAGNQARKRPSTRYFRFQALRECASRSPRQAWRGRME